MISALIVILIAIAFLLIGGFPFSLMYLIRMHPETDFRRMSDCSITDMDYKEHEVTTKSGKSCNEVITWTFTLPGEYEGFHDVELRVGCPQQFGGRAWQGSFHVGAKVYCWVPRNSDVVALSDGWLSSGYSCENKYCYTIFDPSRQRDNQEGRQVMTIAGAVACGVGGLCCWIGRRLENIDAQPSTYTEFGRLPVGT